MIPGLQFLEVRERFLPVKQAMLRERMLREPRLSAQEREQFGKLFEMIAASFHFEFREKLEHLKKIYDWFDADCDTLPPARAPDDEATQREELSRAFEQLLLNANYLEMPRKQVIDCVEYQSQVGLAVRASLLDYAELRVFYRGMRREQRTFRPWFAPWIRKNETVHVFSRVALLVRLAKKPQGPVFLKVFKNVVAEDLEMLMPYVRIHMRLLDHLKIGSSMAGGLATAFWKMFTAAILSPWIFMLVMLGFTGAFIRGVSSFLSNKTRYMQAISANLYFQNLANNSSALAYLVDAAEEEECKELSLVYFILYLAHDQGCRREELDRRTEQWLQTEFGLNVDFEISDALEKLHEKGLLACRGPTASEMPGAEDALKVLDLPAALRRLDETWDNYYCYNKP
jgi:hypothetical protein